MFRSAGFVLNKKSEEAIRCAESAEKLMLSKGISVIDLHEDDSGAVPELIITFGGDGTLLKGARYAMDLDVPLLGVNLGTVGFLTETEPGGIREAIDALISDQYDMEYRSLLQVNNLKSGDRYYAFNDAVISRGGYARLIQVEACVNGQEYGIFTADGLIVATPTGSTGYSLSAGGPIVEPAMDCMVITPICAHSMKHCPCVVSGSSEIRLKLRSEREQTAELQIDGTNRGMLYAGNEILVSGTEKKIRLIRFHACDFFGLIHRKLSEWGS